MTIAIIGLVLGSFIGLSISGAITQVSKAIILLAQAVQNVAEVTAHQNDWLNKS